MSRRNYAAKGSGNSGGPSSNNPRSGGGPPRGQPPMRQNTSNSRDSDDDFNQQNNALLGVPVWQDSNTDIQNGSYLEAGTPHRSASDNSRQPPRHQYSQSNPSTRHHYAQQQLEQQPYQAPQMETDMHVRSLLNQKATQVIAWAETLNRWVQTIESGRVGAAPKRDSFKVGVDMVNRLGTPAELRTMYYTPCANKVVSNFTNEGYRLHCIEEGRSPQLLVVITMYNEDEVEMYSTLKKVANNIEHIKSKKLPGYEGDDSWKNILVCVVSDGRTKANKGTLAFLRDVGVFDEDAMNIMMVGVDVQCHVFEFCVQLKKGKDIADSIASKHLYPPTQVVFALKEHNAGKLNSHEWYFNAFAEQIQPEYTVLLDVGTMPTARAFYLLLAAMELDPQVGGTCGEIAVDRPIPHLCNWVIAAQHFEYKISNIMDKSLESVFGFISVLPGAFSAYRYKAIRGPPLQAYFKSLTTPMHELGAFQGNMYLAEDRILCFELLARKGQRWTMQYVKDAIARTDVPTDLTALIGQRRRWLNGSFFALVYTILNWGRVYTESNHS
ncbi:hypothetical protein AaE_005085, partial [Aphanomyces astaci]